MSSVVKKSPQPPSARPGRAVVGAQCGLSALAHAERHEDVVAHQVEEVARAVRGARVMGGGGHGRHHARSHHVLHRLGHDERVVGVVDPGRAGRRFLRERFEGKADLVLIRLGVEEATLDVGVLVAQVVGVREVAGRHVDGVIEGDAAPVLPHGLLGHVIGDQRLVEAGALEGAQPHHRDTGECRLRHRVRRQTHLVAVRVLTASRRAVAHVVGAVDENSQVVMCCCEGMSLRKLASFTSATREVLEQRGHRSCGQSLRYFLHVLAA